MPRRLSVAYEREPRRGAWTFRHLYGERPLKHPTVRYGLRGRVILAVGQVWVDCYTQELWVIKKLEVVRKGFFIHDVTFVRYRSQGVLCECFKEADFRAAHQVWDSFAESHRVVRIKIKRPTA